MIGSRWIRILMGTGLIGAAVILWVWSESDSASPLPKERILAVKIAHVQVSAGDRTVRFSGFTRSVDRAELGFSVPARLAQRLVEPGHRVREGAPLAALDDREYRNALNAAEARLAEIDIRLSQAIRDRKRAERLVAANAASTEKMEQVTASAEAIHAAREAATAELAEARRRLAETRLVAPFPGTVTDVFRKPGEWVAPGQSVIEISGDGALEVEVEVTEAIALKLSEDQPVRVELPFEGGKSATGRIDSLADAADGPGRLFPVRVLLPPSTGFTAGMAVDVRFDLPENKGMAVPLDAVINPGSSQPCVFQVRDGQAHRVPVTVERLNGTLARVSGPLNPGDRVVVSGHTKLADGDPVEVMP